MTTKNADPLPHIAVVDDERDLTALVAGYLGRNGLRVTEAHDGEGLLALMRNDPPRLVLLDLGLDGEDGLTLAKRVREQWPCGLVFLTGRSDSIDKVVGLEIGADDYITKPFELRELLARVRAVLRRLEPRPSPAAPDGDGKVSFVGWTLDARARLLTDPQGEAVALTSGEFALLSAFVHNAGRVLTRDFLLGQTRGRDAGPFDRTIDVQVGRLRRKLDDDPVDPRMIRSVRGAGYVFVPTVGR